MNQEDGGGNVRLNERLGAKVSREEVQMIRETLIEDCHELLEGSLCIGALGRLEGERDELRAALLLLDERDRNEHCACGSEGCRAVVEAWEAADRALGRA